MASNNEARVTFLAETRDFTAGIKAIDASLATMRSQLKLNAAQMSGSSSDSDQLRDRIKLLATEQDSVKEKVELANQKLQKAASIYGENSMEAEQLRKSLTLAKLQEQAIGNELDAATGALQDQESALGQLSSTISKQEAELAGLKRDYANVVLEQGASSREAKQLASSINGLSGELNENQTRLQSAAGAADELGAGAKKAGDAAESSAGGWTVLKGAMANLISSGIETLVGKLTGLAGTLAELPEGTREYRTEMGKLGTAFSKAGFSAKDATGTYKSLYSVVGETDQATEAANLMANMSKSEGDLTKWTNILTGAFGTYGDSMPIESLMEAASETAKTGTVTGAFADALNWSSDAAKMFSGYMGGDVKTAEDAFNVALSKCSTEQERNALITKTMTKLYGGAAEKYRDTSASVMAANEANANLEASQAKLGAQLEPLQTAWTNFKAKAFDALLPVVKHLSASALPAIQAAAKKIDFSGVEARVRSVIETVKKAVKTVQSVVSFVLANKDTIISAVSAIAGVIVGFKIGSTINTIVTAVKLAGGAMAALGGPITLIIGLIAAVVAALVYLFQHNQSFHDQVVSVFGSVQAKVQEVWTALQPILSAIGTALSFLFTNVIVPSLNFVVGLIGTVITFVCNRILQAISVIQGIASVVSGVIAFIAALPGRIGGIIGGIIAAVSAGLNTVRTVISTVMNAVRSVMGNIWNGIKTVVTTVIGGIKNGVSAGFNAVKSVVTSVMNTVKSIISTIWNGIKAVVTTVVNGIRNTVSTVFNGIKSVTTTVWNGIKNAISTVVNAIKSKVVPVFNGIKSAITTVWNGIKTVTTTVWGAIKKAIINPIETAKEKVGAVIDTIRGFFKFKWSLPKLKVPKFSVSPPGWKIGDLLKGSIPHLSVAWNAQGGIMKSPTLFGGGEAGAEAILPLERNTGWMDTLSEIVSQRVQEGAAEIDYDKIKEIVRDLIDGCTQSLYFKDRELARIVKEVR